LAAHRLFDQGRLGELFGAQTGQDAIDLALDVALPSGPHEGGS
jgi:hypothetical protein